MTYDLGLHMLREPFHFFIEYPFDLARAIHHVLLFLSKSLLLLLTEILGQLVDFLELYWLALGNLDERRSSLSVKIVNLQTKLVFHGQSELVHFKVFEKTSLSKDVYLLYIFKSENR